MIEKAFCQPARGNESANQTKRPKRKIRAVFAWNFLGTAQE
jgi:hypothetical protein